MNKESTSLPGPGFDSYAVKSEVTAAVFPLLEDTTLKEVGTQFSRLETPQLATILGFSFPDVDGGQSFENLGEHVVYLQDAWSRVCGLLPRVIDTEDVITISSDTELIEEMTDALQELLDLVTSATICVPVTDLCTLSLHEKQNLLLNPDDIDTLTPYKFIQYYFSELLIDMYMLQSSHPVTESTSVSPGNTLSKTLDDTGRLYEFMLELNKHLTFVSDDVSTLFSTITSSEFQTKVAYLVSVLKENDLSTVFTTDIIPFEDVSIKNAQKFVLDFFKIWLCSDKDTPPLCTTLLDPNVYTKACEATNQVATDLHNLQSKLEVASEAKSNTFNGTMSTN